MDTLIFVKQKKINFEELHKKYCLIEYENKNPKIKFSDDTCKLFEEFAENKKEIMEKLKTLNKDEANKLYEQYVEDNENILYKIGEATEKFLDSIYYGSAEEQFTEKDWNDTNKILNKYDLELWDIGEGMVTIRELPHLYYDLFKDYVTDDYKEYLKIWAKDNEELYQADAGLMISFEELGERIITTRMAKIIKTLMVTCGMYDSSGEFAVRVGIPSKSGVGGGICSVVPGKMGIGVYGPALDKKGNSLAGGHLLADLSEELSLNIF